MVEIGLELIQKTKLKFKEFSNIDEIGNRFCLNCGVLLEKSKRRYCSQECYEKFRENYIYVRYWVGIRKQVLEKFDYTCQKCKKQFPEKNLPYKQRKLEVHHIIPKSEGGSDEISNFTVLCRKCHNQETMKQIRKLRRMKHNGTNQKVLDGF